VCPWCYVGKRRFEKALAEFEGRDEVEVIWRPFQLDPRAPAQATPALDGYARKFGGPTEALRITERMTQMAEAEGLDFDFGIAQRANTLDAHRLIWLGGEAGVQDAVKERLLRAYFSEGIDVANHDELVRLGAEAGLDGQRVRAMLASDEGLADVQAEIQEGLERGVTAVPTFVFEGTWAVPGAQDPATMLAVLRRVREKLGGAAAERAANDAAACTDDACDF
jgi:predicted DsbA family dithiol-disulfide isomerase